MQLKSDEAMQTLHALMTQAIVARDSKMLSAKAPIIASRELIISENVIPQVASVWQPSPQG